jgi:glyoxylase-like metal-dependent hydrolase (beta-lactamase superfamily II)
MRNLACAGALLLAAVATASAQGQAGRSFAITEVAPGVYAAIGKPGIASNGAFIVSKDDVLVVDTHYRPSWAQDLIADIRKVTDRPVRYVVSTHWHNDHTQGNQSYLAVFGKTVEYISQHTAREDLIKKAIPSVAQALDPSVPNSVPATIATMEQRLADGKDQQGNPLTEPQRQQIRARIEDQKSYLAELKQIQITLPTLTFEKSLVLHKQGAEGLERAIHVYYFGKGHTRGDAVIYLPRDKVVITGDLLTGGVPFARDSYPSLWAGTLEQVHKLDFTQVIPGHGGVQQGKQRLELTIALMKDLVAFVQAGVAKGQTLEQIIAAFDAAKYEASFPNSRPAMINFITRAFAEATGRITD